MALPKRYGINQKTIAKGKGRMSVADGPMGPKNPTSTVLRTEEAVTVAVRQHRSLPLDVVRVVTSRTCRHRRYG